MSFLTTPAAIAALTCTGTISLIPNLILFLFPNYQSHDSLFLFTGQSLAAGGLLGDVFLHTLPEASHLEEAGLWILAGFMVFFAVDLLIRYMDKGHSHAHYRHHTEQNTSEEAAADNVNQKGQRINEEQHSVWWSSTILLNLSADALHNFTDGVAIGASFSLGEHTQDDTVSQLLQSRGGAAFLAILFHEVPHELGDYCVLVHSGLSKQQAIVAQFTTAIAAMIGTVVGLWGAETHSVSMMYMTAGGFVYLAAVNILPSVLEETTSKPLLFQASQLLAFGLGVAFMYGVAVLEDHSEPHHHHHHGHNDRHHHGHDDHHQHHHEL